MKKTILLTMFLAAVLFGLGACGEKSRMDELKDFVEKVQEEGSGYTEEKWQEVNEEFSKLLDKLNDYEDLTPEEVKEIAKYQAEYAKYGKKDRVDEMKEFVEKVQKEASDYTEEKWQEVNAEFSKLLDKLNSYKDLTPEEIKKIAKYQAEFATAAFKQHAGKFMQEVDKTLKKAGSALEGTQKDQTDDSESEEQKSWSLKKI